MPLDVASVDVTPSSGTLLPGATFQLDAVVTDADGLFLIDRPVTWTSLDAAAAGVNAAGLVTAVVSGRPDTVWARIVAASAPRADTVTLVIAPHSVAWLIATPEALSVLPLDTATVGVSALALDLTPLVGRPLTWSSLDPAVATVSAVGLVTAAEHPGPAIRNTQLVVTSGAATDTVPVEVLPRSVVRVIATPDSLTLAPEESAAIALRAESADSTALTDRETLWLSSDTSLVTVTQDGLVTARPYTGADDRTGSVVVYVEGIADTVSIIVPALVATEITVAPDSVELRPGQQTQFDATVRADGTELSGSPIAWTSSDTLVATVNAAGEVVALYYVGPEERSVQVVARTAALADSAVVVVKPLDVDSVAVFPATETLTPNKTVQLDAVLRDSTGLFLEGRAVAWTSSDTVIATVSSSGLVLTRRAGEATISAESGGKVGMMSLSVIQPVAEVQVLPRLSTVWLGRTETFRANLRDSVGVVLADRLITWSSSDSSRATVSSTGVVTALSEGLVTITATAEGIAASASVDLFPEPDAAITITFDDGWRGVLELAAPVLDSLRLRANVGWITSVDWADVMTPAELRTLQASGWSILSHSMSHPHLTQISPDSASAELVGSRNRMIDLGFDARVFIAPYLDHNDTVLAASAAAGYAYTRCCAQDVWSTDTLVSWPIQSEARHRLAGVDVTDYDGQVTTYNFRTADGRTALRNLLLDVVAQGKFIDVFFHDVVPDDVPDLRLTLAILAEFRPYLITYAMLP
jgi:uncharacterized protein YjdB